MRILNIAAAALLVGATASAQDEPARRAATEVNARVPLERAMKGAPVLGGNDRRRHPGPRRRQPHQQENDWSRLSRRRRAHAARGGSPERRGDDLDHRSGRRLLLLARRNEQGRVADADGRRRSHHGQDRGDRRSKPRARIWKSESPRSRRPAAVLLLPVSAGSPLSAPCRRRRPAAGAGRGGAGGTMMRTPAADGSGSPRAQNDRRASRRGAEDHDDDSRGPGRQRAADQYRVRAVALARSQHPRDDEARGSPHRRVDLPA